MSKETRKIIEELKRTALQEKKDGGSIFAPAGRKNTFLRAMDAARNMMGGQEGSGIQIKADKHDIRDIISDEEALALSQAEEAADTRTSDEPGWEPEPKNPENLPALINRALTKGDGKFHPEWHQVKHLPGYMKSTIRALGRQVFSQWTNTPIEDIWMISTMVNSETEVRAMMAWISKNGQRDDKASMDFSNFFTQSFAGMAPVCETQVWTAIDHRFVLVQDFAGYYVYGWPESQTKLKGKSTLLIAK